MAFYNVRSVARETVKKPDPGFSYEFFECKVISLIKMVLFSDDPSEPAFFDVPNVDSVRQRRIG